MPKWLQGMLLPTMLLWLWAVAYGVVCGLWSDSELPGGAKLCASTSLSLIMACWVTADARKRQRKLFYDYDSFVYFAWPIMVPVYLVQTRGFRALLTLLFFAGVWLIAISVSAATYMGYEFVCSRM